ncbi:MAG: hypothetical protein V3S34_01985 [Hyphomicrobium sp.]
MKNRLGVLICALAPLIAMQPSLAQEDQGGMEPLEAPDAEAPSPLAAPMSPTPAILTRSRPRTRLAKRQGR